MPAPTLSHVYNFNDPVERALYAMFTAVGGAAILPRSPDDATEVWIMPSFQQGPSSGHRFRRPDGHYDHDIFQNCSIAWSLTVPRLPQADWTNQLLVATHSLFTQELTRIRRAMDPARHAALDALMPYHRLTELIPQGAPLFGYSEETNEDRAEIYWRCTFGIRPDAWPTDPAAYA